MQSWTNWMCGIFIRAAGAASWLTTSVCWCTSAIRIEISHQRDRGMPWHFIYTCLPGEVRCHGFILYHCEVFWGGRNVSYCYKGWHFCGHGFQGTCWKFLLYPSHIHYFSSVIHVLRVAMCFPVLSELCLGNMHTAGLWRGSVLNVSVGWFIQGKRVQLSSVSSVLINLWS